MKRLFLIFVFCLLSKNMFAAELLVRTKPHWMDDFTQAEVDKMTIEEKQSYNARSQIGDIVVVRPDDWQWGKEERLPNYVVVKVPQMTEAEAKKYEETLQDITDPKNPKLIRIRKYALPKADITAIKVNSVILTKTEVTSKLIAKTGLITEISAPKLNISYLWRKIKSPLMVAYHFWIENAYAATQLLKTVKPSGGDYTSLEACMNANEQNLVTADKYFDVEIDGTWSSADTTAVVIHNYTTDATRYINIYTTAAARHLGVLSLSYYAIDPANALTGINCSVAYITVKGIQVLGITTYPALGMQFSQNNTTVSYCLVTAQSAPAYAIGIFFTGIYKNARYAYNNIIYGFNHATAGYGFQVESQDGTSVYLYNNTVYNCKVGFYQPGAVGASGLRLVNNIANGNSTDYSLAIVPNTATDNISEDTTSPNDEWDSTAVAFVSETAGSEDFHLAAGAAAIDGGTDLSATFTDDIDGVTRSGTWDIGADEFVGAGAARRIWTF